ncbi:Spinocerebellar ataxia type 10 protein domain [Carpediemonas membranifera]|uniref:Spinocerebellar ataxia type 10 protein domain n=1 Tax=Carpediemonas membranifera TaxID=201153 RepID=A0A8J6B8P0_9EUKA|nr:Spinocerebellar ataxia type 10 protein domain [Carpediemonas membranifera]|eukprot:KAG9396544.1 Spinocerebellar ataxia type 10 protein domain [Carpediemonas membranifera]
MDSVSLLRECSRVAELSDAVKASFEAVFAEWDFENELSNLPRLAKAIQAAEDRRRMNHFLYNVIALVCLRRPLKDFTSVAQQFTLDSSFPLTMTAFNTALLALTELSRGIESLQPDERDYAVASGAYGLLCTLVTMASRGIIARPHTLEGPRPNPETAEDMCQHYGFDITDLPAEVTGGVIGVALGRVRLLVLKLLANMTYQCGSAQTYAREAGMLGVFAAGATDDPTTRLGREYGVLLVRNVLEASDENHRVMEALLSRPVPVDDAPEEPRRRTTVRLEVDDDEGVDAVRGCGSGDIEDSF